MRPSLLKFRAMRIGEPFAEREAFELATKGSRGAAFVRDVLVRAVLLRKKATGKASPLETTDTAIPWEIVRNVLFFVHWALEPVRSAWSLSHQPRIYTPRLSPSHHHASHSPAPPPTLPFGEYLALFNCDRYVWPRARRLTSTGASATRPNASPSRSSVSR